MSEERPTAPRASGEPPLTITRNQLAFVGWTMTLLAYIVVLNLWVEINDRVVDIIFGQHVELGGLLDVIVLTLALILSQRAMVAVWRALGPREGAADMDIISE